jgi:dTDP-4-amino-4,6-dideoxygalactose transaminase
MKGAFPVAEKIAETCISLPVFPELTDPQVQSVIEAVNAFR